VFPPRPFLPWPQGGLGLAGAGPTGLDGIDTSWGFSTSSHPLFSLSERAGIVRPRHPYPVLRLRVMKGAGRLLVLTGEISGALCSFRTTRSFLFSATPVQMIPPWFPTLFFSFPTFPDLRTRQGLTTLTRAQRDGLLCRHSSLFIALYVVLPGKGLCSCSRPVRWGPRAVPL